MMAGEFWFSDRQWAVIEPLLPKNQPGARRVDDRRVLSGIVHVLRSGGRWQDCPAIYGPPTTIYNRFHRWSRRGLWQRLLQALAVAEPRRCSPDRQHQRQGPSLGGRCKRGAQAQAIGRSRGGRNDQDPCGRRRPRPSARLHAERRATARRADRADPHRDPTRGQAVRRRRSLRRDAFRQLLIARGTLPVIPNSSSRKRAIRSIPQPTACAT